jgi:hypothetical protein
MWHSLAGERIGELLGQPVEVINLGVPAVGPRFSLRIFQVEGSRLAPDLVLFGLFVGNDLIGELGRPQVVPALERWSLAWRLGSRIVALARYGDQVGTRRRGRPGGPGARSGTGRGGHPVAGYVYDPNVPLISRAAFLLSEQRFSRNFEVGLRGEVAGWIADVCRTVADLDRAVEAAGGRLAVVIIPDRLQLDASLRDAIAGRGRARGVSYDFDWVQPAIIDGLGAAGVAALDLLPAFRAAPPAPPLYRMNNTHWSAVGNALAAEEIVPFLANAGLLQGPGASAGASTPES